MASQNSKTSDIVRAGAGLEMEASSAHPVAYAWMKENASCPQAAWAAQKPGAWGDKQWRNSPQETAAQPTGWGRRRSAYN